MNTYYHALIPELRSDVNPLSHWKDLVVEKYGFHRVIHHCELLPNALFGEKTVISFLMESDDDLVSLRLRTEDLRIIPSVSDVMIAYYESCREVYRPV